MEAASQPVASSSTEVEKAGEVGQYKEPPARFTRLCQASGIERRKFLSYGEVGLEPPHLIPPHMRNGTKFCSDQCRNLFRDTIERRFRQWALEMGGVPEGYEIIYNYRGSGQTVLMSKKSARIVR